ncbi:MAG TPA: hypothetical protein VLZ83_09300 [Edaphocola sp.]|nr:hypothetical protein [Edaphocola sp.]
MDKKTSLFGIIVIDGIVFEEVHSGITNILKIFLFKCFDLKQKYYIFTVYSKTIEKHKL